MSNPKPPTRKELARFLPDQRLIKAFEQLFEVVPSEITTISTETSSTDSKSTQANSLTLEALTASRGANVLLWLSM